MMGATILMNLCGEKLEKGYRGHHKFHPKNHILIAPQLYQLYLEGLNNHI